jgi:hypothetical protein
MRIDLIRATHGWIHLVICLILAVILFKLRKCRGSVSIRMRTSFHSSRRLNIFPKGKIDPKSFFHISRRSSTTQTPSSNPFISDTCNMAAIRAVCRQYQERYEKLIFGTA